MFELIQQKSLLLGSSTAIHELAHKKSARLLVVSDSHGDTNVVRAIMQRFGSSCDALCFCGDGARDVLTALAQGVYNADVASCIPSVVALVQGNGDNPSYSIQGRELVTFSIPKLQLFVACGTIVFLAHGHLYDVYYGTKELYHAAKREKAGIALFGHTHIPYANKEDMLLLNPGSCARPRRGSPESFAIVTLTSNAIDYQFYAIDMASGTPTFAEYTPPAEEISLLWQ